MSAQAAIIAEQQSHSHDETGILCDDGTQSHTLDPHAEAIDQRQRGEDVHHILHDADEHWEARVLHTDKPARKAVESQYGRSAPDNDKEIGLCIRQDISRGAYQRKRNPFHQYLKDNKQ